MTSSSAEEPSIVSNFGFAWYALQAVPNQEGKAKIQIEKLIPLHQMGSFISQVIMPTETVTEVKGGRKVKKERKFYPGYLFIEMKLYDDDGKLLQVPWSFIRNSPGILGFIGGDAPVALKEKEISLILSRMKSAEGKETPKVDFSVNDIVKITDGPFLNFTGNIESINTEKGKLRVAVSIFGRSTPVELEYWQVQKEEK